MINTKIKVDDFVGKLFAIKKLGILKNNMAIELMGFKFLKLKKFLDLKYIKIS
tara:strand:+ start:630 stop:788 length:159 start_codon:yes stop_codon:yes gene_type:complete